MDRFIHYAWDVSTEVAKGDAVFFIGAGLSSVAGALTWDKLVNDLKSALSPPTDVTDPLLISQFFKNQHGDHKLMSHIRALFSHKILRPTQAHKIMCSLPVKVFFTTNYDSLIEQSLTVAGKPLHPRGRSFRAFLTEK